MENASAVELEFEPHGNRRGLFDKCKCRWFGFDWLSNPCSFVNLCTSITTMGLGVFLAVSAEDVGGQALGYTVVVIGLGGSLSTCSNYGRIGVLKRTADVYNNTKDTLYKREDLKEEREDTQMGKEDWAEERDKLEKAVESVEVNFEQITEVSKEQFRKLVSQNQKLQEQLEKQRAVITKFKEVLQQSANATSEVYINIKKLDKDIDKNSKNAKKYHTLNQKLVKEMETLDLAVADQKSLGTKLDILAETFTNQVKALTEYIEELQGAKKNISDELAQLKVQKRELSKAKEELESQISEQKRLIDRNQESEEKLRSQIEKLQKTGKNLAAIDNFFKE